MSDSDSDDDGGMFGFGSGGSISMSRKMMRDEEIEWVTYVVKNLILILVHKRKHLNHLSLNSIHLNIV
jgi:hypothetical protein